MSTNWLLFFTLTILIVISVFVPNIPQVAGEVSAVTNTTLPSSASVWDVLTFNGGWIWDVMTFQYDPASNWPYWLSMIFWLMTFTFIYCIVRLVRGTS